MSGCSQVGFRPPQLPAPSPTPRPTIVCGALASIQLLISARKLSRLVMRGDPFPSAIRLGSVSGPARGRPAGCKAADSSAKLRRMRVLLANPRGFCAGVDRAIEIVELALERYGPPIYVRHEIVHNRHAGAPLAPKAAS